MVVQRILDGAAGGPDAIVSVMAVPAAVSALDLDARLGDRLDIRTPAEMAAIAGFSFHRGVLALVRRPRPLTVGEALDEGVPHRVLLIERLSDADNVGSCFRNARALGATCVLVDDRSADPLYRKAIRTSTGHVLDMPWAQAPMCELLDALTARRIVIIGLTPRTTDSIETVRADMSGDASIAVLVGNEGDGLSDETLTRCDHRARIPMEPGADSLNVATAAAIAMYVTFQRKQGQPIG